MAVDWNNAEYVFVENPACKKCGSERYKRIRTETSSDGAVMRKTICIDCGTPNKFLWDVPRGGNDDQPVEDTGGYYWESDAN